MTKSERRKARKAAYAHGKPLVGELALDRDNYNNVEFSPEHNPDGSINTQRAAALDRYARYVYEYDRD